MLKWSGILVILFASWGYGAHLVWRLQQRGRQLFCVKEMITLFLGEITYGRQPLPEVCLQIQEKLPPPFSEILKGVALALQNQAYQSFEAVWIDQVKQRQKELLLTEEEQQLLCGIGKHLGYLDTDAQMRHLQLYKQEAQVFLEEYEKGKREKTKVYRSVSLLVGAMVCLFFL